MKSQGKGLPSDPDATLRPTSRDQFRVPLPALPFLAPPVMPGDLGQLGSYRILRVLGQGAMGMVLQGEDPSLGRAVAIKIMLPELAARDDMRTRFLRETRAVAALQHDNIVSIYHVGEDQGVPYFAMPLLKGMSLEEYLRRGKELSLGQAVRIAKDVGRGLAAAHDHGLIHRDIKPGNLWVDSAAGGRIKILDFGVARPVQQSSHLTHAGMIIGTPAYMSPEQINGRPEPRSDLYSLGAVLYRALAGRLPFGDRESLDLLVAVATQEPPHLSSLAPHVPEDLADLVMRLLDKNVESRPASARALLEELKGVAKSGSGQAATMMLPPDEAAPTEELPERTPRRVSNAEAPSTRESPQPVRSRKPKRRRKARWTQAVLLGGLAVALLALCVGLVVWLPRLASGENGAEKVSKGETPPQPKTEKSLLSGKSLEGWKTFGERGWSLREGVLTNPAQGKGVLQAPDLLRNFEVDLEWRLPRGGRAGVILRHTSDRPPLGSAEGIEVVMDGRADLRPHVKSCGAILGLLSPKEMPVRNLPAWNHYRIRCDGDWVRLEFNQKEVIDTQKQGSITPLSSRGNLSLHTMGSPVEIRSLIVRELP